MDKMEKANILGCRVDQITLVEAVRLVENFVNEGNPVQVVTLNAEMAYQAQTNRNMQAIINQAALVTPDGISIIWAGRKLGYDLRERVTGIDLLTDICQVAPSKNWGIYLLGSAPGIASQAGENLTKSYPGLILCGTHNGYFQPEELPAIIKQVKDTSPHIIFVGLGSPKQEEWIYSHKMELGVPVCIGVGGSFDVIAGTKRRAPAWMIRLNLEWLYRLISEPVRFKRQLAIPKFMWRVLQQGKVIK